MDFATILKDEATFPDTAEITLGDQKITLGQIRDSSRSQQKAITEQMNALQAERSEVKETAALVASLKAAVEADREKLSTQPSKPDDFDDPWWGPVKNKLTPLQSEITELKNALKAQAAATERAALIWYNDRAKSQYGAKADRLKGPKYAEWTFEKVRDYAAAQRLLDENGLPDLSKAVDEITKVDELERIKAEAREEGRREGALQGRMGQMPRPSSSSGPKTEGKGLDPTKNFEDLGEVAMADRELAEAISQIQGLDPNELLQ